MPSGPVRSITAGHVADTIRRTKPSLEGERRQVTVLFADVQGSMELAEQVDPEDVQTTGACAYAPQVLVERAPLAALRDDTAAARRWLREAHRLFTELGAVGHAERLSRDLGT